MRTRHRLPHLERLERRVLNALRIGHGSLIGMTAEELESRVFLSGNTIRPRLIALAGKGLIRKSEQRRKTRLGRWAAVWVAI